MWLWEDVSVTFTYTSSILTRSLEMKFLNQRKEGTISVQTKKSDIAVVTFLQIVSWICLGLCGQKDNLSFRNPGLEPKILKICSRSCPVTFCTVLGICLNLFVTWPPLEREIILLASINAFKKKKNLWDSQGKLCFPFRGKNDTLPLQQHVDNYLR